MRIRLSSNAMIGWLVAIVVLVLALFSRGGSSEGFQACTADQYTVCLAKKDANARCEGNQECKSNSCVNRKCAGGPAPAPAAAPVAAGNRKQPGTLILDQGQNIRIDPRECSVQAPPFRYNNKMYCPCPSGFIPSGANLNEGCKRPLNAQCRENGDCASNACRKPAGAPMGVCERNPNCERMPCG